MIDLRTAAQQALEAMEEATGVMEVHLDHYFEAMNVLRTALAEPVQEPLTADETMSILNATAGHHWCDEAHLQRFRAAIERAHGIE